MKFDLDKIITIYGEEYIELIKDNIDDVKANLKYFIEIGFNDIEDIFERYTPIFICDNTNFKNKVKTLVRRLGFNYVELIENDLGLLEELLW